MYGVINEALNRVFLGGRFESRPLYLVLDERGRADLSDILSLDPEEVESHCCAVVGSSLAATGDPYKHLEQALWKWSLSGRKDLPPFTALLFTLSRAAELMVSDSNFNAANYYQRLAQVTGLPAAKLSQHGRSTKQFWRAFNGWLADRDFRYGRPTARAVNSNKYVGIAMSQAIAREEDRLRFHSMFEKYGFTGTDVITEEEITQYIETWITTSRPTRQLKAAWAKAELKSRIAGIAVDELEDWTAEIAVTAGAASGQGKRLSLALSFRNDLFSRSVSVWLGREDTIDDLDLRLVGGDKHVVLGNSTFGSFATIEPRSALSLPAVLSRGATLSGPSGDQFNWAARAVIALSRSEKGSYWTEVNRVTIGIENAVLVRADARIKSTVEAVLEEIAAPGYTLATQAVLPGLPDGWLLYENVTIVRQLEQLNGFEAALSPVGQTSGLQFAGGLRIGRGIYHQREPPSAVLETLKPGGRIAAWEGTAAEGEPLCEVSSDLGQASLPLGALNVPTGSLYIEGRTGDEVIGTATILLRSAAKARPLDRQGRGELAYADPLSARPLEFVGSTAVRGVGCADTAGELSSASLAAFTSLNSRDVVPERPLEADGEAAVPTEVPLNISAMPIDQQLALPCAVRGFHEFRLDTVPPNYPKYAPVNMECKKCAMALIHRRQQANKSAPRHKSSKPVPVSAPKLTVQKPPLPHDLWLDATCFLGSGSVASFEGLLASSEVEPWQVGSTLRDLAWLGHLDLCLGENHRPRAWSISPPALAFISERMAVLSGFRCSSLLDDVEELVTSAGGKLHRQELAGQPALVCISDLSIDQTREVLDVASDPHGRVLRIVESPALKLTAFSQATGSIFSRFKPVTLGFDGETQRYDPVRGRWHAATNTDQPGGYRLAHAGTTYVYRTASGRSLSGPHELVKLAAARRQGIHLHAYSESDQVFLSRLGCEPPGLIGRALVACSGRLPETRSGETKFKQVPHSVGGAVLYCLYSGDLPS